jgi:DNA-directed RNA polymerase III subunit RPC8
VIIDLGLCIALHDIIRIGESQLYQGSAHQHALVEFRLVVFRPFAGEVLTGTVVSCDQRGVRMSLGFFDDIFIPNIYLQQPSSWSEEEQLWVWNVTGDDQLFLDLENPARFRVQSVAYRRPAASAAARAPGTPADGAADSEPAAMQITAAVDHPGLGLISWWPPEGDDSDGDGDE